MIRNVIFDIGKVLIGFDWDKYIHSLFDYEICSKVNYAMFTTGYWPELDKADLTEEEILDLFFSAAPDVKDEIREAYDRVGECVERRDWVIPLIDSIKSKGYKVYFLSNFSHHVMYSNPAAMDFLEHMDGGVFSCDVHRIKPDAEIYRILLDKYELVPEECIFIDDHEENVAVARRHGIKGIRYEDPVKMQADLWQALTKDATHDRITVLCYGDSNTYGYDPSNGGRYAYEDRWTSILESMLGDRFEVINCGLNGRTTAYDRPGAVWKNGLVSFASSLGTYKPVDIVILMLGTNDCSEELDLSARDIADGMEELVSAAEDVTPSQQGYRPEVIVAVPAAIRRGGDDSPFRLSTSPDAFRKSREIAPLYRDIAARWCVRYVDATDVEVSSLDGMHLTTDGHKKMAELMYSAITEPCMDVVTISRP